MADILTYLDRQEYPENYTKQQKRDLRKRAADFCLDDGRPILYYRGSRNNFRKAPRQVIFDKETQQRIIR
jgi:hypothetical protein